MRLALIVLPALAALAACGDKAADNGPERKSAAGEVLGGEVSDAMLPLDTVRSTSPVGSNQPEAEAGSSSAPAGRAQPPASESTAADAPPPEPTAAPPAASPAPQGTQGA